MTRAKGDVRAGAGATKNTRHVQFRIFWAGKVIFLNMFAVLGARLDGLILLILAYQILFMFCTRGFEIHFLENYRELGQAGEVLKHNVAAS